MKNTRVTPSATFDQMPSPSHNAKIGASTTRGSALIIFTYGSKTAATSGLRANQKPTSTPATEPMTNASMASTSVIHRGRQIEPSTNQLMTRAMTSYGVEKKNGGSTSTPKIGTVVNTCQMVIAATATKSWRTNSFVRDGITRLPSARSP